MSWALDMGECRNGKLRGAAHSSLMGRMWKASVVAKELLRLVAWCSGITTVGTSSRFNVTLMVARHACVNASHNQWHGRMLTLRVANARWPRGQSVRAESIVSHACSRRYE